MWRSTGSKASAAVAHGLSCSVTCGIFPDQGSDPALGLLSPAWAGRFFTTEPQGSPPDALFHTLPVAGVQGLQPLKAGVQ